MKNLFTIMLITIGLASGANAQVPNGGFESLNADSSLVYWGNVYIVVFSVDTNGNYTTDSLLLDDYWYFPTTDAHTGSYAMELHNGYNVTKGIGITGAAGLDDDSIFSGFGAAFISTQNQLTDLSFFCKFFPVSGDTAIARLKVYDNSYFQIGEANIFITDTVSSYTFFTAPVTFWTPTPGQIKYYTLDFSAFYTDPSCYNEAHYGTRFIIDDVSVDVTSGINSVDKNNNIETYPNPAINLLNIHSENINEKIRSEITDANGKTVMYNDNQLSIDISDLQSGIYFLKVYDNKTVRTARFIKQ